MSAGYLLSHVAFQLPILALLITGLVLVGTRSAQIGPRSTLFARLGLGLLILDSVLGLLWAVLLPELVRSTDYSSSRLGQLSMLNGLASGGLFIGAVGLLIAAIVVRPAAASFPGDPGPPGAPYGPPGPAEPQQAAGPFSTP
jgi:hypothetical protein